MDKNKIPIAMDVSRFPVSYMNLEDFFKKSPELGHINFLGEKLFTDSEELPDILALCAKHNIRVEFSNLAIMRPEALVALVTSGAVERVFFPYEQEAELKPMIDELARIREEHKSPKPEIICIIPDGVPLPTTEQSQEKSAHAKPANNVDAKSKSDASSKIPLRTPVPSSFGFFDLPGGFQNLPCGRLLNYPMINFDGRFVGCWENYQDTPINVFEIGIAAALEHKFVKRMCKMLRTGRLDIDIPCMRCPIFTSLVWNNKRVYIKK